MEKEPYHRKSAEKKMNFKVKFNPNEEFRCFIYR